MEQKKREKSIKAKKIRISDRLLVLFFLLILIGLGAALLLLPQSSFSETENRVLQTAPKFSLSSLFDGSYTKKVSDFCADQFPLRALFAKTKVISETALLRHEADGVLLGSGGYLIDRIEYGGEEYETIRQNASAISVLCEKLEEKEIPAVFAVAPRAIDVLSAHLPPAYPAERARSAWEVLDGTGKEYVSFTEEIEKVGNDGQVWFKTDHHWNAEGAFCAYRVLAETGALPGLSLERSDITFEAASEDFLGTTYSKAKILTGGADTLLLPHFEGEESFVTEIEGKESMSGFYDRSYLEAKDKYSTFIGGNNPVVRITKLPEDGKTREKLLVIKDSFAHSLAPYLAADYDLILVDPRYYPGSAAQLAEAEGADRVLILFGIDTLATVSLRSLGG